MRLMNKRLLAAAKLSRSRHLKYWHFKQFNAAKIKQFVDDVETIKGWFTY